MFPLAEVNGIEMQRARELVHLISEATVIHGTSIQWLRCPGGGDPSRGYSMAILTTGCALWGDQPGLSRQLMLVSLGCFYSQQP